MLPAVLGLPTVAISLSLAWAPPAVEPVSPDTSRDYTDTFELTAPERPQQPESAAEHEPEPADGPKAEPAEEGTVEYDRPDDYEEQQEAAEKGKVKRWWRNRGHRFIIVPSFRADPTIGAMPGLRFRYVRRLPGQSVNRLQIDLGLRVSTKLVQQHDMRVRMRDFIGKNELIQFGVIVFDDPVFPYVGVDNQQEFTNKELDDRFYQARTITLGSFANYQQPAWTVESHEWNQPKLYKKVGVLRWLVGVDFQADFINFNEPEGNEDWDVSLLAQEKPESEDWTLRGNYLGGLTWDSRSNEWSPTWGGLHDVTLALAGPWAGSTEIWGRLNATFRWYRPLGTEKLIFAQRLTFDALIGDVPVYELGRFGGMLPVQGLGGRKAGRGFFRRRYAAPVKGLSITELRYQPIEFNLLRRTVGIGFKGFMDIGEVFQSDAILADGFRISGGGGLFLVWDRFFVFRGDVAVSREGVQWYILSGHAF
jgi:hypothetical protein